MVTFDKTDHTDNQQPDRHINILAYGFIQLLLARHILDPLLDFGKSDRLGAVEQHPDYGVRAAEHLGENFVLVGQGKTRQHILS